MGKVNDTMSLFGPENTLALARRETMEAAQGKGCSCPVCGQFVKVYARTITSTMARQLIYIWHLKRREWFHVREVVMGGSGVGDFPKLEHWGLIVPQSHEKGEEGKRTSGLWRITEQGELFVAGHTTLPKYVFLYNADKRGQSVDEFIDIRDALGTRFDYNDLMAPARAHGSQQAMGAPQ